MNQHMPSEACDGATSAHQAHAIEWRGDTDGAMSLVGVSPARCMLDLWITSLVTHTSNWLQRHWLSLIHGAFTLIVAGALLTPLLYAIGWPQAGHALFAAYHFSCAQIPSHSYFVLGYQLALCARNLAIYGSLLSGSLLFRWARSWLRPLHWSLWLLTMLPMA